MWMPDSRAIYTYERVSADQQILRLFPLDDEKPLKKEIDMPRGIHASFDPAGRWMLTDAFLPERAAIYLMDPASDRQKCLVQFPCEDFSHSTGVHPHPAWSRDGKRIYFNAPLDASVAVMALDLGENPW
jgi:Tol biopolymer transport system component